MAAFTPKIGAEQFADAETLTLIDQSNWLDNTEGYLISNHVRQVVIKDSSLSIIATVPFPGNSLTAEYAVAKCQGLKLEYSALGEQIFTANRVWKKYAVIDDDEFILASPEIPQEANIDLNGVIKANGIRGELTVSGGQISASSPLVTGNVYTYIENGGSALLLGSSPSDRAQIRYQPGSLGPDNKGRPRVWINLNDGSANTGVIAYTDDITDALTNYIPNAKKDVPDGVVGLDANGKYDQRRQKPIPSVADLRLTRGINNNDQVFVSGYYSAGGRGGGWMRWDAIDSTTPDDGGLNFKPTFGSNFGIWKRIFDGIVNPDMFGAIGDGATNSGASLQAAIDTGRTILFEGNRKTYLTDRTLIVARDNQFVNLNGIEIRVHPGFDLGINPIINITGQYCLVNNFRLLGSNRSNGVWISGQGSEIDHFNILGNWTSDVVDCKALVSIVSNGKVRGAPAGSANIQVSNYDAKINNIYTEFGGYGFRTQNFGSVVMRNVHSFANGIGFLIQGAGFCQISSCYADTSDSIGWYILNSPNCRFLDIWGYKSGNVTPSADIRLDGTTQNCAFVGVTGSSNQSNPAQPNIIFNATYPNSWIACYAASINNYTTNHKIVACFGAFRDYEQLIGVNTGDETANSITSKLNNRTLFYKLHITPLLASGVYTVNIPELIGRRVTSVIKNKQGNYRPAPVPLLTNGQVGYSSTTGDLSFLDSLETADTLIIESVPISVSEVPFVQDTFDRTVDGTLAGTFTTAADVIKLWTVISSDSLGVFTTDTGRVYASFGTNTTMAYVDAVANLTVEALASTVKTSGTVSDRFQGLVFRVADLGNYWVVSRSGQTVWRLLKVVAGTTTLVHTSDVTATTGDVIKVICNGSNISYYINNVLKATVNDAFNNTATKVGVSGRGSIDSTSKWSYITLSDLTVGVTDTSPKYIPIGNTTDVVTKAFLNATYSLINAPIGSEVDYYNQGMTYKRVTETIWKESPTSLTP
jgi:hypothetical protein